MVDSFVKLSWARRLLASGELLRQRGVPLAQDLVLGLGLVALAAGAVDVVHPAVDVAERLRNALRSRLERRRDADSLALGAVQRTGVSFTEVASQQAERGKYEDAQYQPAAGDAVERGHRSDGRAGHDARGTLVDRERRKAPSRPFVGSTSVPASLLRRAICSESWNWFQKSRGVRRAWIVLRAGGCARSSRRPQPSGDPDPAHINSVILSGIGERAPGLRRDAGWLLIRPPACPASHPTPPLAPDTPTTPRYF